jgi:pimeloyl-ACP methyl ester carboxylesterase
LRALAEIRWKPCAEDAAAQCGALRLPVDWRRRDGAAFDLAVARRPATDPAARIGSLIVNPGGPGGSGVDFALYGNDYFSAEITRRFDLVGFDPRGVSRSRPVVCDLATLRQAPPAEIGSAAQFAAVVAYNARLWKDCRRHTGPLFDHVDTLSVVRDVEALRAAVGDERLTFYGMSYGTLIGQQYAELFPGRVRAVVLDSAMDHSSGTRRFLREEAVAVQDSFDQFVAGCQADAGCALHGRDIRAVWRGLLARAARGELRDPTFPEYRPTPFDVVSAAFGAFYGPQWRELAMFLTALDTGQAAGGGVGVAGAGVGKVGAAVAGGVAGLAGAAARQRIRRTKAIELVEYAFPAAFCADWRLPVRDYPDLAGYLHTSGLLAPDMRYSPLAVTAVTACLGWPGRLHNPQHRLALRGDARVLVLGALHDPATAYSWSDRAARQAGDNGVLLTYEGWGHGVYGRGRCPGRAVDAYLVSLTLPAAGARCPAVPPTQPAGDRAGPVRSGSIRPGQVGPRPGVRGWSPGGGQLR